MRVGRSTGAHARVADNARGSLARIALSHAVVATLAIGCGAAVTPTGGDDDGGISSSPLTVELIIDPADADVATLLGWPEGRVPGAQVRVERENVDGSIDDALVETTDADGRAVFSSIYGGIHRVSALKLLTAEEVALVTSTRPLLRAFGGGRKSIGSTQETFSLTVRANQADGMVVSELSTVDAANSEGIWFGYLELYNNSPDVQYLDGMLVGRAFNANWEQDLLSCDDKLEFADDPEGIWARYFQRFPGAGNQYPVQPGETVLLAFDAIDHSQDYPWRFDLSNADFEFRTQSDADNPAVPDLIDAGPRAAVGGGIQMLVDAAPFVALPLDTSTLPQGRAQSPLTDDVFVRIPTSHVADVFDQIHGNLTSPAMICPAGINANFSHLEYVWKRVPDAHLMSPQRRPVGTAPGGWTILLDTNTNSIDFYEEMRTPDDLP